MDKGSTGVVHIGQDEGRRLWVADELMTFVVSGRETGGRYALTDSTVPPDGEAPSHIHHREDEASPRRQDATRMEMPP